MTSIKDKKQFAPHGSLDKARALGVTVKNTLLWDWRGRIFASVLVAISIGVVLWPSTPSSETKPYNASVGTKSAGLPADLGERIEINENYICYSIQTQHQAYQCYSRDEAGVFTLVAVY